jgi:hypothetical protein
VSEAIDHVIDKLMSGIRTEALISTALLLTWLAIAVGGLIFASTHMTRHDAAEGSPYVIDPAVDHENAAKEYPTTPPPYEYPVNKAAPYTLQPRPFQTYGPNDDAATEKVGQVDARTGTPIVRPGHARTSSHVQLADSSPLDEKQNPFADSRRSRKENPFRDQ